VRTRTCIVLSLLLIGALCPRPAEAGQPWVSDRATSEPSGPPQRGDGAAAGDVAGVWTGTWEGGGAGSGGFELTFEKSKDGTLGGRVSVTGEPTYTATLRTLSIADKKLSATYDFPPDESLEVVLAATIEGATAKGTWSARQKSGGELASGTWTVTRK
jgi:hypothetical protein